MTSVSGLCSNGCHGHLVWQCLLLCRGGQVTQAKFGTHRGENFGSLVQVVALALKVVASILESTADAQVTLCLRESKRLGFLGLSAAVSAVLDAGVSTLAMLLALDLLGHEQTSRKRRPSVSVVSG